MKKINLLIGTLLTTVALSHAVDSYSDVVGYSKLSINQGGRLIAPVFIKAAVCSGSSTVTSGVFSASGLSAGALNQTAFSDRPNFPTHYVKVTSAGSYEGLVLDVVSNTATSVTVAGAPAGLTGSVTIQVIPHYTLLDLANQSADLAPYSDAVTFYDSGNNKRTYYYAGGSDGFVADDYSTPSGHVIIDPGTGVILNAGGNSSITMTGVVNNKKTLVPVYAGESIVAPLDPSGISKVSDINLAPAIAAYSDAASVVLLNGSLATSTYYSDGTGMLDDGYNALDSSTSPVLAVGNGFIINAGADGIWVQNPVISGN